MRSWVSVVVAVVAVVSQVLPSATPAAAYAAAVVAVVADAGLGPLDNAAVAAAAASWQTRHFPRLLGERAPRGEGCSPAALPWKQLQRQLGRRHQRQERHHLTETHHKRDLRRARDLLPCRRFVKKSRVWKGNKF